MMDFGKFLLLSEATLSNHEDLTYVPSKKFEDKFKSIGLTDMEEEFTSLSSDEIKKYPKPYYEIDGVKIIQTPKLPVDKDSYSYWFSHDIEKVFFIKKSASTNLFIQNKEVSSKDTSIKEALVVVLWAIDQKDKIETDGDLAELRSLILNTSKWKKNVNLSNDTISKIISFISKAQIATNKKFINDKISISKELCNSYSTRDYILDRDELLDKIKSKCSKKLSLNKDKWCPADILFVKKEDKGRILKEIEKTIERHDEFEDILVGELNNYFEDDWGAEESPVVLISLKEEESQHGWSLSAIKDKFPKKGKEYKIQPDELNQTDAWYEERIKEMRLNLKNYCTKHSIDFAFKPGQVDASKPDIWFSKYGSYKLIDTIISYFEPDIFIELVTHGSSLGNKNPPFFKIVGNPTAEAKIETFGNNIGTINAEVKQITESERSAYIGLFIDLELDDKANRYFLVSRRKDTKFFNIAIKYITPIQKVEETT